MSDQQKAVVFDVDGVLAEFCLPFKSFINNYFPYRVAPTGAQANWQYSGLSRPELEKVWEQVNLGKWDWSTLPTLLTSGDEFAIQELRRVGQVTFEYVSNRQGPRAKVQTEAWLAHNGLPSGRVSIVDNKVDFIQSNIPNCIAIIEDAPANLEAYTAAGWDDKLFIRDWPYNRQGGYKRARRVSSVAEFCFTLIRDITQRDIETGLRLGPVSDPVGTAGESAKVITS